MRAITERMEADLWDAVSRQELKLPIDRVFSLDDVQAALTHMRSNAHFGKILLKPS
jgi:NADPH2:quinone reductase